MTQIIFCIICVVALRVCYFAEKKEKKGYLVIAILILSFAAGLRDETVGIDTRSYIENFRTNFPYYWKFSEEGFRIISRLLMKLFNNPSVLLVIYALITNTLIIFRFWELKENSSFSLMMVMYILIHYINTMNIMRQYLAIAIVFFGTRYLPQKKYVVFVLLLILSASIHTTALLGIALLIIYFWKNITKKVRVWIVGPLIVILAVAYVYIAQYERVNINNYFSMSYDNLNIVFLYRVMVFVTAIILQYSKIHIYLSKNQEKRDKKVNNSSDGENAVIKICDNDSVITILTLIMSSFGMFFMYLSRLGLYYALFEIVFWGRVSRIGKSRSFLILLFMVYCLYIFTTELVGNGSGVFPYTIHFI